MTTSAEDSGKEKVTIREAIEAADEDLRAGQEPEAEEGDVKIETSAPKSSGEAPEPVKRGPGRPRKQALETSQPVEGEQPVPAPQYFSADARSVFTKLDPATQRVIAGEFQKAQEYVHRMSGETQQARETLNRLNEVFTPERVRDLKLKGLKPETALDYLWGWQETLDANPADGIVRLMRSYGLTPESLFMADKQVTQQEGGFDPRIQELSQKLEEVTGKLTGWESQYTQAQQEQMVQLANQLLEEKGPYAKFLRPQIAEVVLSLEQQYPQADKRQIFETAYNHVMQQYQGAFGSVPSNGNGEQAPNEAVVQKAIAAKRAASSISSSTNGTSEPKPRIRSVREALEAAHRDLSMR